MGGHDEKLKNFGKSEKKGELYELDNFKKKSFFYKKKFQNRDRKCHFSTDF